MQPDLFVWYSCDRTKGLTAKSGLYRSTACYNSLVTPIKFCVTYQSVAKAERLYRRRLLFTLWIFPYRLCLFLQLGEMRSELLTGRYGTLVKVSILYVWGRGFEHESVLVLLFLSYFKEKFASRN